MTVADIITVVTTATGLFFFVAGTLGVLRFPDLFSRLHALTKADNLGLGFIATGVMVQLGTIADAAQILLIWLLVMVGGVVSSFLIADHALKSHPIIPRTKGETP